MITSSLTCVTLLSSTYNWVVLDLFLSLSWWQQYLQKYHCLLTNYCCDTGTTNDLWLCYSVLFTSYCIIVLHLFLGWSHSILNLVLRYHFLLVWASELLFVNHYLCRLESCFCYDLPIVEISYGCEFSCDHVLPVFSTTRFIHTHTLLVLPVSYFLNEFVCS